MHNDSRQGRFFLALVRAISLAVGFFLLVGCSKFSGPPELLPQTRNLIHLQSIGVFIKLYAAKHAGKYPDSWTELSRSGVVTDLPPDLGATGYESAAGKQQQNWLYFPGGNTRSLPEIIIAASPVAADDPQTPNLRLVLFADLKVKRIPDAAYHVQLSKQHATPSPP